MRENPLETDLADYDWAGAGLSPDLSREQIEHRREKKFVEQVQYAFENTRYYSELFNDYNLSPNDITGLGDITRIPPTTSDDLANATIEFPDYPFLAAGWDDVRRVNESSGTSGGPKKYYLVTQNDLDAIAQDMVRMYEDRDIDGDDRFLMALPYGMNTSGLAVHETVDMVEGFEVPVGILSPPEEHAEAVETYEPTVFWALPSYAARFENVLESKGVDPAESSIEHVFTGGEAFSDQQLRHLEGVYDADVTQVYGLTEAGGVIGGETERGNGLHVLEDAFVVEIVDPETSEPVPDGEMGEVLFTALDREGTPLLRYAPGDMSRFRTDDDGLASPFKRIATPWRKKEVSHIEGVEIYPNKISDYLFDLDAAKIDQYGLNEQFQIRLDFDENEHKYYMDILVESVVQDAELEEMMKRNLGQILEFESIQKQDVADITVKTVPIGSLRTRGKAERFVDRRVDGVERHR